MTKTISELWNGNIIPVMHSGKNNPKTKKLEKAMSCTRENLEDSLDKSQKELFEKYYNCVNDYVIVISEQSFSEGFSLGTKITSEALNAAEEML